MLDLITAANDIIGSFYDCGASIDGNGIRCPHPDAGVTAGF
jgi:hypothetical protein